MKYRACLFLTAFGVAAFAVAPSQAQPATAERIVGDYVLLSDEIGRPEYIVGASGDLPREPIEALRAAPLTSERIGSLFANLCIASNFDRTAYHTARAEHAPEFVTANYVLSGYSAARPLVGSRQVPEVEFAQEHSSYGRSSLWLGENSAEIKGRTTLTYSGQIVITHPFDPEDSFSPQCNVTLRVSGLTASAGVLDAIQNAATGFTALKRVEKPKYGYATWTRAAENGRIVRIKADVSGLNKAEQTVHLTFQLLPVGKTN